MKTDDNKHVLDPESTEAVLLDEYDRYVIEEALLWFADEKEDREEWQEHFETLANHVTRD